LTRLSYAGSIKPAGSVPLGELNDGAVRVAHVELASQEDAFLAVFFLENLDPFGGKESLGPFILLRIDLERVVGSTAVFGIPLERCIASSRIT
jgi:hypothetical protein